MCVGGGGGGGGGVPQNIMRALCAAMRPDHFKLVPVRYRPNAASGGWRYGRDHVSLPRRA